MEKGPKIEKKLILSPNDGKNKDHIGLQGRD